MSGYNKSNRKNSRGLYVPPFRQFTPPTDFDEDLSTYGSSRGVEIPLAGGGRHFAARGPIPRGGQSRYDPYRGSRPRDGRGRRKNDRRKHKGGHDNQRDDRHDKNNEGRWFKVQIPFGKKIGKDFILSSLLAISTVPFVPFSFQYEGNAAFFYVDNYEASHSLRGTNKRISTPNGTKMTVLITNAPPPVLSMDGEALENMKLCMNKRFNVELNLLDLSNFHHDADLKSQGLYLPLNRHRVFETAVKIIKEHIPQLEGLDLSSNRLYNINAMSDLKTECKALKSINFKSNSFRHITELDSLKGFSSVVELILDGNLLCDKFKDQASYISAIRDRMPNVMKLDGLDLPPPIVFDLGQAEIVPAVKPSYFPSEDVKAIVLPFLESFFSLYDSNNRQDLLAGYHDDAFFSISVYKTSKQGSYGNALQKYYSKSRNLLRMSKDSDLKYSTLKHGKVNIVAALSDLPPTAHDPTTMTVDIAHASGTLMTFTVMGVFKETNQAKAHLLNFARTFIVVPTSDARILIINDMLYLGTATSEQIKVYKANTANSIDAGPVTSTSVSISSDEEKQALVLQMVQTSGMNIPYATRCLEENEWKLQQAISVFSELKNQGVIPPEAF